MVLQESVPAGVFLYIALLDFKGTVSIGIFQQVYKSFLNLE
jgi:hypothetical protein